MKDKDLPIDRSKHVLYTKNAKKCVQKLLRRYYDDVTAAELWEKVQLKYAEFLQEEPALGSAKITVSIYDPILIFAWYTVVPDMPTIEEIQQDIYDCFMGSFDTLGKVFNLNRKLDSRLAGKVFKKTSDIREKEIVDRAGILGFLVKAWLACHAQPEPAGRQDHFVSFASYPFLLSFDLR